MKRGTFRWLGAACIVATLAGAGGLYWRSRMAIADPVAALVAGGRLRDAQLRLRDALAKAPNAPELHLQMGELQLKLADPIAAEKELRRAVALGTPADGVVRSLARALLLQQRSAEVLRMIPASGATPAVAARNLLLRAEAQLADGNLPAAKETLALGRSAAPQEADTFLAAKIAAADPASASSASKYL